jgi:serine/threonine-protein phosphatase 2A regulatory subunit B''
MQALSQTVHTTENSHHAHHAQPHVSSSAPKIPRFHARPREGTMAHALYLEARKVFLDRKHSELLDSHQIKALSHTLSDFSDSGLMNYEQYFYAASALVDEGILTQAQAQEYLSPHTFLMFATDAMGAAPVSLIASYVRQKSCLTANRIALSVHDVDGDGYLTEQDLEAYVNDCILMIPGVASLPESFFPFYACAASRKFLFFLDAQKRGRVSITDILASPVLAEFLTVQLNNPIRELLMMDPPSTVTAMNSATGLAKPRENWFGREVSVRVYSTFLDLDHDANGLLSKEELGAWNHGSLTAAFVDRVFACSQTYDGQLDYKAFLDFVLAQTYKTETASLGYHFRLLDVQHTGQLTAFAINYFFRDMVKKLQDSGQEPPAVEDVKDEIFDMVKPRNPLAITLDDLIASKVGHTVVSILSDLQGFWTYENRESLMQQSDGDEEQDS